MPKPQLYKQNLTQFSRLCSREVIRWERRVSVIRRRLRCAVWVARNMHEYIIFINYQDLLFVSANFFTRVNLLLLLLKHQRISFSTSQNSQIGWSFHSTFLLSSEFRIQNFEFLNSVFSASWRREPERSVPSPGELWERGNRPRRSAAELF